MTMQNANRIRRAACLLLAAAIPAMCFAACAGRADSTGGSASSAPEAQSEPLEQTAERPPLVEPELAAAGLVNGDFEQYFDAYGALPGWKVEFSAWGEGEAAASFDLSAEDDNTPNPTQKLSLYNGMAQPVEFTVSQTVEGPAAGSYIVALIFEGGAADTDAQTALYVNGKSVEFGRFAGWKNWRQVASEAFAVAEGEAVVIEIRGTLESKGWMDLDEIELTPADAFRPRSFAADGTGAAVYDRLTNGDFETGEDAYGHLPGWTVEFANWGSGSARAGYRLTTEDDNFNTTQKLSLGNSTGKRNAFTITQQFFSAGTGQYIVALDWESATGPTDFYLSVNGRRLALGNATGWKNWGQNASEPFAVRRGDVVTVEIGGTLEDGGWLDIDNVIFMPAADFVQQLYPYYYWAEPAAAAPMSFVTMDHIQNGDFSEEVIWTDAGNPDGYLPGWILPKIDWDTWRYTVAAGEFNLSNISGSTAAGTFELKQYVQLAAGRYTLNAWSGWTWDENNPAGITMRVKADGRVLAETQKNPGWGDLVTDDFTLDEATTVEVSFVFSLSGGAQLGLDNVEFRPWPAPVEWRAAEQLGGALGTQSTTGVRLQFDKNIPDLDVSHFTVTGAAAGSLTRTDIGEYELTLQNITVDDGEAVTIGIDPPAGYAVSPESRAVTVYKAPQTPGPTFTDPIQNGDFSATWPLPENWTVSIDGSVISTQDQLNAWESQHKNSDDDTSLLTTQFHETVTDTGSKWDGFKIYGTSNDALKNFSLKQTVTLSAGTYRLNCSFNNEPWGFYIMIEGIDGAEQETGAKSNKLEFTVAREGDYTIAFVKRATTYGTYVELLSMSLEKIS